MAYLSVLSAAIREYAYVGVFSLLKEIAIGI